MSLLQNAQTGSETQPASYTVDIGSKVATGRRWHLTSI